MKLTPVRPRPDPNISPNLDNENNHCDSCKRTFSSKGSYWHHLDLVRTMITPPRIQRQAPNPNILPDIDDPFHYCKSCNYYYKGPAAYRQYLKRIHKIEFAPLRKTRDM